MCDVGKYPDHVNKSYAVKVFNALTLQVNNAETISFSTFWISFGPRDVIFNEVDIDKSIGDGYSSCHLVHCLPEIWDFRGFPQ